MTVEDFLEVYGGNVKITIEGYCKELEIDEIADNFDLFDKVKDKKITFFNVIGGGIYDGEIVMDVKDVVVDDDE